MNPRTPPNTTTGVDMPPELRGVSDLLDALASHERAAAPSGLEESIFLSLSLSAAGRDAMDAAPPDLEERIFAATRGTLAAAAAENTPVLRLVGEGPPLAASNPRLSPDAVRRALEPRTVWWRSPALRAAAVFAVLFVPAFMIVMSLRPTSIGRSQQLGNNTLPAEPVTKLALTTQIDAELDTLMTVFDDTLPAPTAAVGASTTTDSQTLDDDWFGMAEFLSEDSL